MQQSAAEHLREVIQRMNNFGGDFVHDGILYYLTEQGRTACQPRDRKTPLGEADILDGTEVIEKSMFADTTMQNLHIPASVEVMEEEAFAHAHTVDVVTDSPIVGDSAFLFTDVHNVTVNSPEIKVSAFHGVHASCITLSDTVERIQSDAFGGAVIPEIRFGRNIEHIARMAFQRCEYTEAVDMGMCDKLTRLPSYAFTYCKRLKSVRFPPNLTELGKNVFVNTAFSTLDMRDVNVSVITRCCFSSCRNLREIYLPLCCTEVQEDAFESCPVLETIYVSRDAELNEKALRRAGAETEGGKTAVQYY